MSHHCHAVDCPIEVPPELLMCKDHWFTVPRRVRAAVQRHYRPGQCDDKNPSAEWHRAADGAIGWVAMREGKRLRTGHVAALVFFGYKGSLIREYVNRGFTEEVIVAEINKAVGIWQNRVA